MQRALRTMCTSTHALAAATRPGGLRKPVSTFPGVDAPSAAAPAKPTPTYATNVTASDAPTARHIVRVALGGSCSVDCTSSSTAENE